MKHYLTIVLLYLVTATTYGQCIFENFYKLYPTNEGYYVKTIETKDGGFITTTGAYSDSLDPGEGDEDMWIVKTDACGNTLWINHCGVSSEGDDAHDVVETDSGDYLVTGYAAFQQSQGNIRIAKFSKEGELKWNKLYTGNKLSNPESITKRKNRDTYIVSGYIGYSGTDVQGYVLEIDDTGKVLKSKTFTEFDINTYPRITIPKIFSLNDTSYLMIALSEDTLFMMETDTSFNVKWIRKPFEGSIDLFYDACLSYDQKSIAITMDAQIIPMWYSDDLLARINLQGELLDYKIPSDTFGYHTAVTATSDGGYLLNSRLMKLDSNLNYRWDRSLNGFLTSIIVTDVGTIVGSGMSGVRTLKPDGTFIYELYITNMDSLGNTLYAPVKEYDQRMADCSIYPNPTSAWLTIETVTTAPLHMELVTTTGQVVYHSSFVKTVQLSTEEFPSGIYLCRITDPSSGAVLTKRFVIMK